MASSLNEGKDRFMAQHSGEYPVLAMSKGIVKHMGTEDLLQG